MIPHPATASGRRALARLIDDVLTVWPDNGAQAACSDVLVDRLVRFRPAAYRGLDVRSFGGIMRSMGVYTVSVRNGVYVRRGIRRDDLRGRNRGHPPVVYFVERHGFVKIGTTHNLRNRVDELNRGGSAIPGMHIIPVAVVATMPGDRTVERAIHDLFAALRFEGEWFLFDDPLITFVESVAAARAMRPHHDLESDEGEDDDWPLSSDDGQDF